MPKPIVAKGTDPSPLATSNAAAWAAKRAQGKKTKPRRDDGALGKRDPIVTPERRQHDKIEPVRSERDGSDVVIRDERTGHIGTPHYVVGLLDTMLKSGSITDNERSAGRRFRDDFDSAHYQSVKAIDWSRPIVDGGRRESGTDDPGVIRSLNAGIRVQKAILAAGGMRSRKGSALWHILGLGDSISEWSRWGAAPIEAGTEEKPQHGVVSIDRRTGAGILIGALEALVVHYGMDRRKSS